MHVCRAYGCGRGAVACVLARGANADPVPITNSDLQVVYYGAPLITSGHPVKGTGVNNPDGFVSADEWEFCFGFNGRLKRKFFTHAYHI